MFQYWSARRKGIGSFADDLQLDDCWCGVPEILGMIRNRQPQILRLRLA
jgi:hypothetical protein